MKSKLILAVLGLFALAFGFTVVLYRHNHASPLYGLWREVKAANGFIAEYNADGKAYGYWRHGETSSLPYSLDGKYIFIRDSGDGQPARIEWSVTDDGKYLTIINPRTGPHYFERVYSKTDFGEEVKTTSIPEPSSQLPDKENNVPSSVGTFTTPAAPVVSTPPMTYTPPVTQQNPSIREPLDDYDSKAEDEKTEAMKRESMMRLPPPPEFPNPLDKNGKLPGFGNAAQSNPADSDRSQ